jgi:cytochrome P450
MVFESAPANFGHMDLLSPEYCQDPHPWLAAAQQRGGILHDPQLDLWMVFGHDDVRDVLMRPFEFSSAGTSQDPVVPLSESAENIMGRVQLDTAPTISSSSGEGHRRLRSAFVRTLSAKRIAIMRGRAKQDATNLAAAMHDSGSPFEFMSGFASPFTSEAIFSLIGFPRNDHESLRIWCHDRLMLTWGRLDEAGQMAAATGLAKLREYCKMFVEDRWASGTGDRLVDDLTQFSRTNPDQLGKSEVVAIISSLSFAGHETTARLMGNLVLLVGSTPGAWGQIVADPGLAPLAVEEALRLEPPIFAWRRRTTRVCRLAGTTIPAQATVLLSIGATGRDPAVFEQGPRFALEAASRKHLAFGRGVHSCPGASLARAQAVEALCVLSRAFPTLNLVSNTHPWTPNLSFRGPSALWLEW